MSFFCYLLYDLMQFLRDKSFKQKIPQVKVEDGEEITYETSTTALRRAVHFFSALQSSDGHWPAENSGVLFSLPPLVSSLLFPLWRQFFGRVLISSHYYLPHLECGQFCPQFVSMFKFMDNDIHNLWTILLGGIRCTWYGGIFSLFCNQ